MDERRQQSAKERQAPQVEVPWITDEPCIIDEAEPIENVKPPTSEDDELIKEIIRGDADTSGDDRFVEVGDEVTYCFLDNPSAKLIVTITEGASDPTYPQRLSPIR